MEGPPNYERPEREKDNKENYRQIPNNGEFLDKILRKNLSQDRFAF